MLEDRADNRLPVGSIDPVAGSLQRQQPGTWDFLRQRRAVPCRI